MLHNFEKATLSVVSFTGKLILVFDHVGKNKAVLIDQSRPKTIGNSPWFKELPPK
jgi:hypothetical protein